MPVMAGIIWLDQLHCKIMVMKNKELFTLNPEKVNLKNEGVAKVRAIDERKICRLLSMS